MTKAVNYAQSVLERYWDRTIPINPDQIIQSMTTSMDNPDLILEKVPLSDDISGQIKYDFDKKTYVISINSNKHPHHQRFTLAHELGHYALSHGEKYDNQITLYRNGTSDPDEIEANAFSAELLMPKAVIRHLVFKENITDISKLAQELFVSEQAMMYRLKNLGLIQ